MSLLLSPVEIAGLNLKNRVVMSPMCMYEVKKQDGVVTPFHFGHYGARAIGQVGLIIIEATGVTPDGRISSQDLGLWNDQQKTELKKLVDQLHYLGSQVGLQLNHAGRKAEDADYPLAPSAIAYNEEFATPNEMTLDEIQLVEQAFVDAVQRAVSAGVDMIELHGAHGYLMDQFLSPLTNQRTDQYGGSLENRYRFVKEVVEKVRAIYQGPLWIRLSLTNYADPKEQNSIEDFQQIGQWLEQAGINCLDISTGGLLDRQPNFPIHAGYQTPFATKMKEAVTIPVATVGLLSDPGMCEYIVENQQADLVVLGRELLRNPNWLVEAANDLHDHDFKVYNHSYQRGQMKNVAERKQYGDAK